MALEKADWLLGTIEGHVYMVVAYTAVIIVQGYAYLRISQRSEKPANTPAGGSFA